MAWPKTPVSQLIHAILADGQWHDYEDLVGWVAASGLVNGSKPRTVSGKLTRNLKSLARESVKSVGRSNSYEMKLRPVGTRHYIEAIRKRPGGVRGQTLKTCATCGASGLEIHQRVRKVLEFRIPRAKSRVGRTTGLGDITAAKMPTTFLCIPCADHELQVQGLQWRVKPPFDYSAGEVRRDEETLNIEGYERKRHYGMALRGEHLPKEER